MTEYERRLLERLVNNLRALRDEIRAIREHQQTEDNSSDDESGRRFRVEITNAPHLDPALREYYESENRERNSLWIKLKPWAEVIAIATALSLAIFTFLTLLEVKEQTTMAEQQTRPWIKLVDVIIAESADSKNQFPVLNFQTMPWPVPNGKTTQKLTATISLELTVKNIGKGVARDVLIQPVLVFDKWNSTNILANDEQKVCSRATEWNPGVPFVWSSIFPDEVRKSRIMTVGFYEGDMAYHPTDRAGSWISGVVFGCVGYQSSLGYRTEAVFHIMGEKDRFVEAGKNLTSAEQLHLLRDEHYEYAQ